MGVDMIQVGIKMRRYMGVYIKVCYRSVCNHPFLVGMLGLFFLLYRSFPFLFSLLVSASPVLVCTAVLLGTLLSFGNPQIPEIDEGEEGEEEEENLRREVSNLKASAIEDETVVVNRDENEEFVVERYSGKRKDVIERDRDTSEDIGVSIAEKNKPLLESRTIMDESEAEVNSDKQVPEVSRDMHLESNGDIHEESCSERLLDGREDGEHRYTLIREESCENLELESSGLVRDSTDAIFKSSRESEWKEKDEEDDEDDLSVDSGSDQAESSSPDASMADILPMLDELHPLLDSEAPKPAPSTHVNSDAGSEHSDKSEKGVQESDEDNEEQGEEDGDNSNDEEEEEEVQGTKEDESKSAIVWTEDDQKNLMDLGTSELERNRRLENLIARRRARKSFKVTAEKNLIDFDSDLPFNVPPIATTRCNPFDGPYESYNLLDLPPIPGSAPSVMSKRRNPFDIPYDPNEEKPDLKGDSFQQEFITNQRDAVFCRHESFHVGPSNLGLNRHEKQDFKWRPYFVPEHLAGEGTSYAFERQSSGVSDSKISSVPDTDSVNSAGDHEEKRTIEQDDSHEMEAVSNLDRVSLIVEHGSESSIDVDAQEIEEVEARGATHDEAEITLGDSGDQHEIQSNSSEEAEQASEHEIGANITEVKQANQHEIAVSLSEAAPQVTSPAVDTKDVQMGAETVVEVYSSRSSSSYFSEVSEKIADLEKEESTSAADLDEEISSPKQQHIEKHEFSATPGTVGEDHHKEPVYDSSPPATEKYLSFSSISSDKQGEKSEMFLPTEMAKVVDGESKVHVQSMQRDGPDYQEMLAVPSKVETIKGSDSESSEMFSPPETAKSIFPSEDRDFGKHSESMQKADPGSEKMVAGCSHTHAIEEHESSFDKAVEISKDEVNIFRHVETEENFGHQNGSLVHESLVEPSSTGPASPSSQVKTVDEHNVLIGDLKDKHIHVDPSSFDAECTNSFQSQDDESDSKAFHGALSSKESNMTELHVKQPASVSGQATDSVPDVSSSKIDLTEDEIAKNEISQFEQRHANLLSCNSLMEVHLASIDEHEEAQVPSRVDSDASVHESMVELPGVPAPSHHERTSDGGAISMPDDQHPPPVFDNVSVTPLDSSLIESKLEEGDFINDEDSNKNIQSSNAMEDAALTVNLDIKVSSSDCANTYVSTDRPLKPEKQELSSDEFINQSASMGHIEEQDFCVTAAKLDAEDSSSNRNLEKIDNNENKDFPSAATSNLEPISESSSSPEIVSPTYAAELSHDAVHENEIGSHRKVSEYHESQNETSGSHVDRRSIEVVDEIKEIDEGFLTELDTVGDFRVKEADECMQEEIMVENPDFGVSCNDQHSVESRSNLPVLEVRSVEDITVAFRQLDEGADVEEVIIPSSITSTADTVDEDIVENGSGLQVVEAKSLDDIQQVMKHASDKQEELHHKTGFKHEFTETEGDDVSSSSENGSTHCEPSFKESASFNKPEESDLNATALAVRSVEDNTDTAASRQLGAEAIAEEVSLCSSTNYLHGISGSQGPVEICTALQAVERSAEDVELTMQQNTEENKQEDVRNADSLNNPATEKSDNVCKINQAGTTDSSNMDFDVPESTVLGKTSKDSSDKTSDFSSLVTHESGSKKEKSHKSTSSSSSSSSSSDSD